MKQPQTSFIIATYNWKEALTLSLASVLNQTQPPTEIIIADDGSREDTRLVIESFQREHTIPIVHIWHEDKGNRKTTILNEAIKAAKYEYIIQIDGDAFVEKHFIADHLSVAKKGSFICGSRVKLNQANTDKILADSSFRTNVLNLRVHSVLNSFRSKLLRNYLADRFAKEDISRLRGCNMAFWRSDLLLVNGYNEAFTAWSCEDAEIAYRLLHAGVQKRMLKMGGICYHLNHKEASKHNVAYQTTLLQEVIDHKIKWCEDGIQKPKKE